jgi:hypothetical protein
MGAELPLITGGGLTDRYNFVQLHFHWGRSFSSSEHRIDGEQCKVDQIAYGIYDSIHFIMLFTPILDIRPNCTWSITIRNTELLAKLCLTRMDWLYLGLWLRFKYSLFR